MKRFAPRSTRYQKPNRIIPRSTVPAVRHTSRRALIIPVVALLALFGFGLLYVSQTNAAATQGTTIRDLQDRLASVALENQELELHIATLRSLTAVEQSSEVLDLLVRAPVHYLPAVTSSVALGK